MKANNAKEVARLKILLEESERMLQDKKNEIHKLKCDFANIAENEDVRYKKMSRNLLEIS